MTLSSLRSALFALVTLVSNAVLADLLPRLGGQAVYDSAQGITWLADAGGAGSARGAMSWADAVEWVGAYALGEAIDWRLPATVHPDPSCQSPTTSSGLNCTGSEMGHLFYVGLSGTAGESIGNSTDPDLALFNNLEGADWWSGTSFTIPELAWHFRFANGNQNASNKAPFAFFVWPVPDGDVFGQASDDAGVTDDADNCTEAANADQRDTDGDGFGNVCDADITGDCSVTFADLGAFKAVFFPNPYDADADFNGDGSVNFGDLVLIKSSFFNGPAPGPGPSGVPVGCRQPTT